MNTHILYHDNCLDGFGAALACWMQFGDAATYIPVQYGKPVPDIPDGTDIYIVDFSYPRNVLLELVGDGKQNSVTVIDHHKTAEQALADLEHINIRVIFNMKESGATLTWRFFASMQNPDTFIPPLLFQYLRDRDLWLWELPSSKEISAAIASYPKDFKLWEPWLDDRQIVRLAKDGEAILRYQNKLIDGLSHNAELHELDGHRIFVINTPLFGSEIGNNLCSENQDIAFAACYSKQADGRWRYELRSIGDFDVSEVAKRFDGGGHKNAAGFICSRLLFG